MKSAGLKPAEGSSMIMQKQKILKIWKSRYKNQKHLKLLEQSAQRSKKYRVEQKNAKKRVAEEIPTITKSLKIYDDRGRPRLMKDLEIIVTFNASRKKKE